MKLSPAVLFVGVFPPLQSSYPTTLVLSSLGLSCPWPLWVGVSFPLWLQVEGAMPEPPNIMAHPGSIREGN